MTTDAEELLNDIQHGVLETDKPPAVQLAEIHEMIVRFWNERK